MSGATVLGLLFWKVIADEMRYRYVVGAVLDLLQGNVTRQVMSSRCWARDVVFEDGLNVAKGRGELEDGR